MLGRVLQPALRAACGHFTPVYRCAHVAPARSLKHSAYHLKVANIERTFSSGMQSPSVSQHYKKLPVVFLALPALWLISGESEEEEPIESSHTTQCATETEPPSVSKPPGSAKEPTQKSAVKKETKASKPGASQVWL